MTDLASAPVSTLAPVHPRVRAVLVNWNGGAMVARAVEHLLACGWPNLEVVVVDNGSTDGSAGPLEDLPGVDVLRLAENRGFAGGSNAGMDGLDDVDYVALVNSDAFVTPGWLDPLVAALAADRGLGAACPRIVFAPRFHAPGWAPGGGDDRILGVRVVAFRAAGQDVTRSTLWPAGVFAEEANGPAGEASFRWTGPEATIWLPLPADGEPSFQLLLAAPQPVTIELSSGSATTRAAVGPEPTWVDVRTAPPEFDVINNVGARLSADCHGADRGYGERDDGQYSSPAEVFGWCGAAVVLSTDYLRDVGFFDDSFFLYYEDTDLSWRGRARGWRYQYVPDSVVRHVHAATTIEGSSMFEHLVKRNRLLTIVHNAPTSVVASELARYLRDLAILVRLEVARPLSHRRRPYPQLLRTYCRAGGGAVRLLPGALRVRRSINRRRRIRPKEIMVWAGRS
jgi:GT2 family glycosyltransferase